MSALPLFRVPIYRAHIPQQMRNPNKPHPAKVAVMDQKDPKDDEFLKTELVLHNGHWCIRALEPVEPLTTELVREMIEVTRDERRR